MGSGKTSVILQMARYLTEKRKETVAIVENEIGEIGIDDKVLVAGGLTVRGVFAGCVCCQITGELVEAIQEIHATIAPSWLIIEATGLAVPGKIVDLLSRYCRCFTALRTVVLVDAERWDELYEVLEGLVVSQIGAADVVLINKADLVEGESLEFLSDQIKRLNGTARVYLTSASQGIPDSTFREVLES